MKGCGPVSGVIGARGGPVAPRLYHKSATNQRVQELACEHGDLLLPHLSRRPSASVGSSARYLPGTIAAGWRRKVAAGRSGASCLPANAVG